MVSAPTGRVCKKNAQAVPITTKIRIVIRFTIAPSSKASSVPLSTSCSRCTQPLCCISSPTHLVPRLPTHVILSCAPFSPFCFFLSNDVVAAPSLRKSRWRRMWHSSLTRQYWEARWKKVAYVASRHRLNQISIYMCKRSRKYTLDFPRRMNWAQESHRLKIFLMNTLNVDWSLTERFEISRSRINSYIRIFQKEIILS